MRQRGKNKKVRHPSRDRSAPGPCSTPACRRDTGSPRGPPPRSRTAGTTAIPCTSRRCRRRPRGGPRAGARVEASSPRRPSERTMMARVCRLRGDATARPRTLGGTPRRARDASAERLDTVARRAKCRPRLGSRSAGDSSGTRRRRAFARASLVSSVASGTRNASPGGIRQSEGGKFAREVRFMASRSQIASRANRTEGYRLVRDLWRNRPTRSLGSFGSPSFRTRVQKSSARSSRLLRVKDPRSARALPLDAALPTWWLSSP